MPNISVVGIDPGLIDTGVVRIGMDTTSHIIETQHAVVPGMDPAQVRDWLAVAPPTFTFIEKYRPRSNFGTDERMVQGERDFRVMFPKAVFLNNTGVRTVVKPGVLKALGLWQFRLHTHHDDLRSAARIAVLGMMKDVEMNKVLAEIIRNEIDGAPWTIVDLGGDRL